MHKADTLATFMCRFLRILEASPPGALGTYLGLYRDGFTLPGLVIHLQTAEC